jgi:hypothetical protein
MSKLRKFVDDSFAKEIEREKELKELITTKKDLFNITVAITPN